jgi:N,N'-diacetyllegionaminate synthase
MKLIIIAEAGVNHNGNITLAKKLVDVAKNAGADYVKFQSFLHDNLVVKKAAKAKYQKKNSKSNETQDEMLKKLQLSKKNQIVLIKYCKKKKIKFLSTAFDKESLKFLLRHKIDYIKIPSGEITNLPYLEFISNQKKRCLLSTGASNLEEIKNALKILRKKGNLKQIIILHCNTAYPTPIIDVNLNVLNTFKKNFGNNFGLSDHSLSINVPLAATIMGATVIEKHFTLSRKLSGPDHKSSLEPTELKNMIKNIKEIQLALGKNKKVVTISEAENRKIIRRSIVADTIIEKGEKFTNLNLTVKRPGNGISPMKIKSVIGKKSKKKFNKDDKIII